MVYGLGGRIRRFLMNWHFPSDNPDPT